MQELVKSTPEDILLRLYKTTDQSPVTGATVQVDILKPGATSWVTATGGGGGTCTEVSSGGWYRFVPGSSNIDTLGTMVIRGSAATADLAEFKVKIVVAKTGALASIDPALWVFFGIEAMGTVNATGTISGETVLDAALNFGADDVPKGAQLGIYAGTGAGQSVVIESYVNGADKCVHKPFPITPNGTSKYVVWFGSPEPLGLLQVEVMKVNGVTQTGRDLGADMITQGTGPKQIQLTNGQVTATPSTGTAPSAVQIRQEIDTNSIVLPAIIAAIASLPTADNFVTALVAHPDFKTILADSNGIFTMTYPLTYPGNGTLVMRDKVGGVIRGNFTIAFDVDGNPTSRASS